MRVIMQQVAVPRGERGVAFSCAGPGILRSCFIALAQLTVVTPGQPSVEEVPLLYVETHEGQPMVDRHYVLVPQGAGIKGTGDKAAVYCATAVSPATGEAVHVFELVEPV